MHTIEVKSSEGALISRITRKRFDAFVFQAHQAVYDTANRQALRDTKSAWAALRAVYDHGRNGMSNIKLGSYWIVLNTD